MKSKMQTFFIIFLIILFMSFFGSSILAYGFWWTRPSVIQPHEKINDIEYSINDTNESDTVTVRAYLSTDQGRRKLGTSDSLSINGILMHAKYYNTGLASGYEYIEKIPRSPKYVLSLKREGAEEITKVIIASGFLATFPLKLNQNTDNIIPFTSEIPISGEKIYIGFSSLSRAPIAKDANGYLHTESSIYGKIVDNTILLTPEDIKNFLPGPMKISLSNIIKQTDGTYSVQSIGNIELVKE